MVLRILGFLAPSLSNSSRNGFGSFCSLIKRDHFIFWHWCILSFLASSSEAALFLFLIERMRLSLSPHPKLSVIALLGLREDKSASEVVREQVSAAIS